MSPPIRDGSGSSIGSIRLGDGSEISEVRTGTGDVLFSGSAIPDSALYQWLLNEGSGQTAADRVGSADLSLNFSGWVSDSNAVGGFVLGFDGRDDEGTATAPISTESEILFCVTIEKGSNSGRRYAVGWDETAAFGTLRGGLSDDVALFDATDGSDINRLIGSTTVTDGIKHRLAFGVIENDEAFVAVDTAKEATTPYSTFGAIDDTFVAGRDPTGTDGFGANYDNIVVYNDASQSKVDADFDNQPWS